jgi:hypothetical protein
MVFDNDADTVTVYLNGEARSIGSTPEGNPMFKHQAKAWADGLYRPRRRSRVSRRPVRFPRANPYWFPYDLYTPPPGEGLLTIGRPIASWATRRSRG